VADLWDDDVAPEAHRAQQKAEAVKFAELYLVFETDGRAKALLEHWEKTIEEKNVPPSASHAEFAYAEGRRVFVRGIRQQLEFARQNA
jgi:hypothetical protein